MTVYVVETYRIKSLDNIIPALATASSIAACKKRSRDAPFVESSFASLLVSQLDELVCLLQQLHSVMTDYMYYRFHYVDYTFRWQRF